jgi:hypothetical protein
LHSPGASSLCRFERRFGAHPVFATPKLYPALAEKWFNILDIKRTLSRRAHVEKLSIAI